MRITPACAGNTGRLECNPVALWDHPRLRGEYNSFRRLPTVQPGITPACAGNTGFLVAVRRINEDHPRLRGEYIHSRPMKFGRRGSPPLARGIRRLCNRYSVYKGITPACAGNTWQSRRLLRSAWDHPRLRGEYTFLLLANMTISGSPPLARGIHCPCLLPLPATGITPACAGNTLKRIPYLQPFLNLYL